MQTGCTVFLIIFPILLQGCCVGNHRKSNTGLKLSLGHQQDIIHQHYRVVEGEIFGTPCVECENQCTEVVRSRTGDRDERPAFICGSKFVAEAKHSGNYTCGSKLCFQLQVVEKNSLRCFQPDESSKNLILGAGGMVACPGVNCSDNTNVIWYKGNKTVSKQRRASCQKNGWLHLCQVKEPDTGVYFCDRQIIEQGVNWTFRRAVNVTIISSYTPRSSPRIIYPDLNTTAEVELGQSYTLVCKISFPSEINFLPEVWWYMHHGDNMENMIPLHMDNLRQEKITIREFRVTRSAIIKEVTQQHLDATYTCIARNAVGNCSVSVTLKRKIKVKWPSLDGYPIACLVLVAGLGIVLHVKWLELQIMYRSHFQHGKHKGDEKEFDVLLSYVWSPISPDVEDVSMLSGPDEEACSSSMDPLTSEECKATQRPLEVLVPQVLEDQWGYRLCLLERDVIPGGAYTNDVVLAIQRSRMLVCLLSADYLSNSDAVFVLESGIRALLQKSTLKLLLIWTNRASAARVQLDPPLPTLVQRALKVLPSLDWTSGKSTRATSNFWRSLRKAMPNHKMKLVSLM